MKDAKMIEIENTSFMRSVVNVNPVIIIEKEPGGASIILIIVNDGVYICKCSVISDEYICKTKYAFVYYSNLRPLHQSKCCGDLIYNISDVPIVVLGDTARERKLNLRHALKQIGGMCTVEYVIKITPCR